MATKLIKTTGGDYSTLSAHAAYANVLSLSANEIGEVSGTVSDTSKVTYSGITLNGFTFTLRAASGEGVSAGGAARHLTSGRATLTNSVGYDGSYVFGSGMTVQDIQIRATSSTSSFVVQAALATVERCIISQASASSGLGVSGNGGAQGQSKFRSCLILTVGGNGGSNSTYLDLERCTLVGNGSGTGVNSSYSQTRAQGCIVYNYGTNFAGTAAATSSHNAVSQATFAGTGWGTSGQTSLSSSDFVSTTGGSEDYSAASGSTKLKDTGTTISGVTVDLFNVSIPQNGTADIGATEVAAGGGGGSSIAVISNYYRMLRSAR